MLGSEAEHRVIRLVGSVLMTGKPLPGTTENLVAPTVEELAIGIEGILGRVKVLLNFDGECLWLLSLLSTKVRQKVANRALHVTTESSSPRIGVTKVTSEKSKRELLSQLRGQVGVARHAEQVALNGTGVTNH